MTVAGGAADVDGTRRTVSGLERHGLVPTTVVLGIVLVLTVGATLVDSLIPTGVSRSRLHVRDHGQDQRRFDRRAE
jgi:hypothetical protein